MLDESDDKPRRNLMVISLLFIIYALAGGNLTEKGNFGLAFMTFSKPEILEYIAVALFIYFYWSYWVTHKGIADAFQHEVTKNIRKQSDKYLQDVTRAVLHGLEKTPGNIQAVSHLENIYRRDRNLPTPELIGFMEWVVPVNTSIKLPNAVHPIKIDVVARLNSDLILLLRLQTTIRLMLTTPSFRDNVLPYALAICAMLITIYT